VTKAPRLKAISIQSDGKRAAGGDGASEIWFELENGMIAGLAQHDE
jgi:hypothetical protein